MINAVSELPAIVINGLYELSAQVDRNAVGKNKQQDNKSEQINRNKDKNKEDLSLNPPSPEESKDKKDDNKVDFNDLAAKLKNMLKDTDLAIEFTYDDEVNKMIMKLIDEKKDEVVKQFPPEIAIKIARIVASTLGNGQVTDARI